MGGKGLGHIENQAAFYRQTTSFVTPKTVLSGKTAKKSKNGFFPMPALKIKGLGQEKHRSLRVYTNIKLRENLSLKQLNKAIDLHTRKLCFPGYTRYLLNEETQNQINPKNPPPGPSPRLFTKPSINQKTLRWKQKLYDGKILPPLSPC